MADGQDMMGSLGQWWDDPKNRMLMTLGLNLLANSGQAPAGTTLGQRIGQAGLATAPMMGQMRTELQAREKEKKTLADQKALSEMFASGANPAQILAAGANVDPTEAMKAWTQTMGRPGDAGQKAPPGYNVNVSRDAAGNLTNVVTRLDENGRIVSTIVPIEQPGGQGTPGAGLVKNPNVLYEQEKTNQQLSKDVFNRQEGSVLEFYKGAMNEKNALTKIQEARDLIDNKGIITGIGAEIKTGGGRVANSIIEAFGGNVSNDPVANTQLFKSLISQMSVDSAYKLAPVTEKELQSLIKWNGGDVTQEKPAISTLLKLYEGAIKQKIEANNKLIYDFYTNSNLPEKDKERSIKMYTLPLPREKRWSLESIREYPKNGKSDI